jgi:creatinine amidohydrolase
MKRIFLFVLLSLSAFAQTQQLRVRWEELTAPDFRAGIEKSGGTCLLPIGILEKHGPHLPLGTDLLNVRKTALDAASREYAIVFPEYYFGQIFEAQQEPGTIAYSAELQMKMLQETTDEMARNGCKKVIVVNGHGGNNSFLPYFAQTQMAKPHDYVVYIFELHSHTPGGPPRKTTIDMHAGESETSTTMVNFPDLVKMDQVKTQSGEDQARQHLPDTLYTGIWWYARFPNHYSGDGSAATKELGEYEMTQWTSALVDAIKAVKADKDSKKIQDEYYQKISHPLDTRP